MQRARRIPLAPSSSRRLGLGGRPGGGDIGAPSKMASAAGFLRAWGSHGRLSLGIPAQREFWGGSRKEESKPKITEPVIPVKDPVVICPPPKSRKYLPPEDLQSRVEFRVREIFGSTVAKDWQKASLGDSGLKYRLLAQLAVDLGHTVPNSQLHQMKSAGDVVAFYRIPVKDISNFDELSTKELPPNLRINWQY
ncbi:hypothetical protein JRQ81_013302 [Phrynocephalus forsythii]|uniref:Large ribosomal subunit protein mL50 n=1 Tax=Phrynocephalus forsythii TaxID=171643 RepID=A0A9Q0XZX4_9SAUR|nr:hypothetical protein JRQ81_013302 [Phrynocephalus forsythii]